MAAVFLGSTMQTRYQPQIVRVNQSRKLRTSICHRQMFEFATQSVRNWYYLSEMAQLFMYFTIIRLVSFSDPHYKLVMTS